MATNYHTPNSDTITSIANGDSLIVTRGNVAITSNVDHSAIAGIADVSINRPFTSDVGSSSAYFTAAITGRLLYNAGGGNFYYTINGSGTDACALLTNSGLGTMHVAGAGTLTKLNAMSGITHVGEGVDLTTFRNAGGLAYLEYDATAVTAFDQTAGRTILRRPGPGSAATWNIGGGVLEIGKKSEDGTSLTYTNVTFAVGDALVKFSCEGTIAAIKLTHPKARIDLTQIPDALTISLLEGDPVALKNSGLTSGVNSINGKAITISAIDYYGLSSNQYGDISL